VPQAPGTNTLAHLIARRLPALALSHGLPGQHPIAPESLEDKEAGTRGPLRQVDATIWSAIEEAQDLGRSTHGCFYLMPCF